jgi:glycosyltransferase involved in cell wall biosynthesis
LSDKIFCRDEQIKNLVFGSLISLGRFNLNNYNLNKKLKELIEVAPFGIDNSSFSKKRGFYRGVYKNIASDSFILNWNGGIWNWNDAETLIRAMYILRDKNIKLVFQGYKHPSANSNISQEAQKAYSLAEKLKLKDKNIFFVDTWVPHSERSGFLLESDIGLVSSPDIPEANLFFKTRIYDYLWTEKPIILNDCEAFATLVKKKNLGLISKTGDVKSWARNIEILSRDTKMMEKIKLNIREYKKEILWSKTLRPLSSFLKNPHNLKDKYNKKNNLILKNIKLNKNIVLN